MKLEELNIGDLRPGTVSESDAIAGCNIRVSGELEKPSRTPSGQDHGLTAEFLNTTADAIEGSHPFSYPILNDDLGHQEMLQNSDLSQPCHLAEGNLNMLTGGITAGVQDPGHAMSCLPSESYLPVKGIENNPEVYQVDDAVRSFINKDAHRLRVTQPSPGSYGIPIMELGGIPFANCGGNPTLGMLGVAFVDAALGQDDHAPLLPRQEGGVKPGDAAANYDVVVVVHLSPPAFSSLPRSCHRGHALP